MKKLLWIGLLFLSMSLLFFIPIFNIPDYIIGIAFLAAGIIINTIGFWKHEFKKINLRYLLLIIPLLICIFIVPFPYSLGPIVITIAALIYICLHFLGKQNLNWITLGVGFSGFVISVQTLFLPVYTIFVTHGHRVDILSPVVSWIANVLGLNTSVNNGIIFIQTFSHNYPVTTTWEKLGFFPWFNILIGALVLFLFFSDYKKIAKYILVFFAISGIYIIFRFVIVLYIFTQIRDISLFWNQIFLTLSFVPFVFLLVRYLKLKDLKIDLSCFSELKIKKTQVFAAIFAFIFIFSLVGAFAFQDPGTKKQGRVLIDELHSDWETTEIPLDKEWYGMLSTYNYYSWAEWLDKYYTVERNLEDYLTYDLLKNYDILILKCPTDPYTNQEIGDIVKFVKAGGGLYLIGDHTNVFGMNYYLNQISEEFGISFLIDSTYELGTGMTSTYEPDVLLPHVIVQNMEKFEFLTSCTLSAPINSENVIIGNRLLGEPGTYSTVNFFRETREALDIEYGLLLQVAAVKHGNGRVLAFTDSTCFSNFCMFMDGGYKEFNLGVIEYLNRENKYSYLNNLFLLISVFSLVAFLFFLRKEKKIMIIYVLFTAGILAFSLAAPTFSYINSENYKTPMEHSDYPKVAFEQEYSDAKILHSSILDDINVKNRFSTFFVWIQRVGLFPSVHNSLDEAIAQGDTVVIINPIKSFKDTKDLEDYVNYGGNLLVMDSILNAKSTANELLEKFGIYLDYETIVYTLYNSSNESIYANDSNYTGVGNIVTPYLSIKGEADQLFTKENNTFVVIVNRGEGKLVVVVDSYTFTDKILGGTFTEPDSELRKIYDLQYYIFEEILFNQ